MLFFVVSDSQVAPAPQDNELWTVVPEAGGFYVAQSLGGKFYLDCADVFFQAIEFGCSRNRNDPGLLGK